MIKQFFIPALLAAASFLAAPLASAQATPLTFQPGDLLIGFRATGLTGNTTGVTQCYVINAGPAGAFVGAGAPFTVPVTGIKADLDGQYGTDWITRDDMFWGAVATTDSAAGDPSSTIYATKLQAVVGTPNSSGTRWARQSSFTQAQPINKIETAGTGYSTNASNGNPRNSTGNNSKGLFEDNSESTSWTSYQPAPPNITNSFSYFSPSIEDDFASGTAGAVLELYRMKPSGGGVPNGTSGEFLGTFSIDDNGVITFAPAPPEGISLSSATYAVSENVGAGKIVLTLNRTGSTAAAATVNVTTGGGSAMAGTDYTALTNAPVTFAIGDTQETIDVLIADRAEVQGDRTFNVTLTAVGAAPVSTPASAVVTILESDTGVKLETATYAVNEEVGTVPIKLQRTGVGAAFTATVNTTDGSAQEGEDYTVQTNVSVPFLATDTEKTVNVPIADRAGVQGNRDFTFTITGSDNGTTIGTPSAATVTISDVLLSGSVAFSAASYQKSEPASGTTTLAITVSRTGGNEGAVSVDVVVTGGSAQSPDDFTLPATPVPLSWPNGVDGPQSFDITIKSDTVSEATAETILLALQNQQGGVTLGAPNTATVTLPGEDAVAPTVTVATPKANAKLTAPNVTFGGTATDNTNIARVEVALNGGAPANTTPPSPRTSFIWTITAIPEQGLNTAVVTAFDDAGNASAPVTINFTFTNLRTQLAGNYNGLLVNSTAASPFDRNGLVAVKVTKTGTFTGKVTISGVALPISGLFLTGGDARFGKTKTVNFELIKKAKPANISLGFLTLTLDTGAGLKVTGALKDAGATTLATIPRADLAVYTSKKNPIAPLKNVPVTLYDATKEKGKYTAALLPPTVVPANTPAGNGFGTVTISTGGLVKIVATLADGTKVTYKNALSNDNHLPVFIPIYSKQGFIAGDVVFDPAQAQTDATSAFNWFKPAGLAKQTLYPNGWPAGLASNFIASKFFVPTVPSAKNPNPANPDTVLGLGVPAASVLEILLTDGGLATDTSNDATIDAKSKVTVGGATAGQTGANGLTAKFVASSGALNGSFTHPGATKAVKFAGVAYQKTNVAYGHFLFLPTAGTAESGAVGVVKK